MKVAVLGPVCRDETIVSRKKHVIMGGIPFYVGKAFQALGISCTLFISHAEEDLAWVKKELSGLNLVHFFSKKTLCFRSNYSEENPNERKIEIDYTPGTIGLEVASSLEEFDYVVIGPLFYGDVDESLFKKLKHKKLVLGNFGMFNYAEGNKAVKKHPEKAVAVLKYLDWLFLDEEEVKFVAGKESVEEAVLSLQKHVKKIAVTRNFKGSELFIGRKKIRVPAFPPKTMADPTGAGDTFLAAFIAGLSFFKEDYEKAGNFAAIAATASIEVKGALKASKEELLERLA